MSTLPDRVPGQHSRSPWLRRQSIAIKLVATLLGVLVLTASSWVAIPMLPVPMTLQTLVVMLVGALYGWRLGGLTVVLWLLLAASGLPLLAGGSGGWERFLGPTGGFLLAFPLAAALTGWLAERGWDGGRVGRAFAAMLIGHVLCLLLGGAWLAASIGLPKALAAGVLPFIPGALLKSALGAGLLKAIAVMRAPPTA